MFLHIALCVYFVDPIYSVFGVLKIFSVFSKFMFIFILLIAIGACMATGLRAGKWLPKT